MKRVIRPGGMAGRFDPGQGSGFIVNFPDLPNGWCQGETHDEALAQAGDLLDEICSRVDWRRSSAPACTTTNLRWSASFGQWWARACRQLSQIVAAARWTAARKFLAVLS